MLLFALLLLGFDEDSIVALDGFCARMMRSNGLQIDGDGTLQERLSFRILSTIL